MPVWAPADGQRGGPSDGPPAGPASSDEPTGPRRARNVVRLKGEAQALKPGAAGLPSGLGAAPVALGPSGPSGRGPEPAGDQGDDGSQDRAGRRARRRARRQARVVESAAADQVGSASSYSASDAGASDAGARDARVGRRGRRARKQAEQETGGVVPFEDRARPVPATPLAPEVAPEILPAPETQTEPKRAQGGRGRGAAAQAPTAAVKVPPPAKAARTKPRHFFAVGLFLVMVAFPVGATSWYLYNRSTDQFASFLGFTVRQEEGPSASEVLTGITLGGAQSSSDADVLNEFIQSQDIVERIDERLDLRAIYTRPDGQDPIFALKDGATIEDLVSHWQRMVTVYYDVGRGLLEVRALAFSPEEAQAINEAIYSESLGMINELSAIAREDATRYARADFDEAVARLKDARTALTTFRAETQIVDPNADIQIQMGLLNTLQAQLADELINLDLLSETARDGDPRIGQTELRIEVIQNRIDEERAKFGIGESSRGGGAFASLVGEYESLIVDREIAETAYQTALTNYDAAQAEAQRQSRYLAAYVPPTAAESSEFPRRGQIIALMALFASMAWATVTLIYYSIKDRR